MSDRLCDRLREVRLSCDMTQQQVADALNIDRSTYTCYELGKTEPSMTGIKNIAKIFNVDVRVLLADIGERNFADYIRTHESSRRDKLKIFELKKDEQDLLAKYRLLSDDEKKELLREVKRKRGNAKIREIK